jgi:tetratricopeptide (TPR) repeat protein
MESKDAEAERQLRQAFLLNPTPDNEMGGLARNYLALVLSRKGDLSEAWQMESEAVEIVERVDGPDSPNLAINRHNLAAILRDMGNILEAEKSERQTLAIWRQVAAEHADVAYALNNLGFLLLAEGDWKQAAPLLQEALEMRRKQLGEKHPLVALSLANWGRVLQAKGDYSGAEKSLGQALDMLRETSGPESWNVAKVLSNLGLVRLDRGDYPGAGGLRQTSFGNASQARRR